jgi:DNA-binding LacI/PurR family transcriptional regulator
LVQVDSDHFSGCREVTAHALSRGFGRIALLAGDPGHQVNKDRYAGFMAAFKDVGTEPDPACVHWNLASGERVDRAMSQVMKKTPDCLLCMDDVICGRVLSWLQKKKYEIPADVRIASFHDSAFMEMHNPPVTALHVDLPSLSAAAGKVLLDMIEGKEPDRAVRVGCALVIRDSTRPKSAAGEDI